MTDCEPTLREIVFGDPEGIYDNSDLKDLIAPDPRLGPYYPHNMRYDKKHI